MITGKLKGMIRGKLRLLAGDTAGIMFLFGKQSLLWGREFTQDISPSDLELVNLREGEGTVKPRGLYKVVDFYSEPTKYFPLCQFCHMSSYQNQQGFALCL